MLLLLKIQNLIPVFLNSSTHGFFSLFVYYQCNQIIMFRWTQQKNYQIHLSRLCALSSHKYFLHMTWPLRKKPLIHSGMSGNDFCDVGNENRNGEFLSRGWGTLRDEKNVPNFGNGKEMRKNIDAMTPGNGNRNGENKKEWYDYTKKIFRNIWREIKFCHQIFWNTPSSFFNNPSFFRGNRNSRSSLYSFCKSCNVVCRKQSKEVLVLVLWSKVSVAWIYLGPLRWHFYRG